MLVLSRKVGQRVKIGDNVWVKVIRVNGETVRLGIEAPDGVIILREELTPQPSPDGVGQTDAKEPTSRVA